MSRESGRVLFVSSIANAAGFLLMVLVLARLPVFGHSFFLHTLIGGSLLVVGGSQLIAFAICARVRPTRSNNRATRSAFCRPLAMPWVDNGSPTMSPTVIRGLSEENGS